LLDELVSDINENNIFHVFEWDIIRHYHPDYKKISIFKDNINPNDLVQQWRYFVMKKLYGKEINYTNQRQPSFITYSGFDCFQFIKYKPSKHMIHIYEKLCPKIYGKYILVVQRNKNDRYLYEYNTKLELQDYLQNKKFKMPVKCCNFSIMTPQEQYDACANSALIIMAHGSGCTNVIFTPKQTPLIEINFRKHWYCDLVCDVHFYEKISINEKCNGKLTCLEHFHKADYHNLCYLIEKKYVEMEAVEYAGKFNTRNPISKQQIYVDGLLLEKHINDFLNSITWLRC